MNPLSVPKLNLNLWDLKNKQQLKLSEKNFNAFAKKKINKNLKKIFSKSLAVNKDLKKNHSIKIQDLETKKPGGMGISSKDYKKIVGKKINKNLKKNSFLKLRDFG